MAHSSARSELAAAFLRQPLGRHGPALQALVNEVRNEPLAGKYVLLCTRPHREWVLGRLPGVRGAPVEVLESVVFTDVAEAERHVFRLRWKRLTGEELA